MTNNTIRDELKVVYDGYYEDGPSEWRRIGAECKVANIVGLCQAVPHSTILEIGAGDGAILTRLSELNFGSAYYALDVSISGVEAIKSRQLPNLVECQVFDGAYIPYPDNTFDLVILSHVVEHLEYPRQLIYEASRVAKHVFIEVPLEHTIRLKRDFVVDKVGHINVYTPTTIRWLVQSCNMAVLKEVITNPSKETHTYQRKVAGSAIYHMKTILLALLPKVAAVLFCYRSSILAKSINTTRSTNTDSTT